MGVSVNVGGTWENATPYVNVGGTWAPVKAGYTNVGGTWQQFYQNLSITTQPQSQEVGAPNTNTFSVVAVGATAYQWYRNGSLISGATSSSYTTPATSASNNGDQYYCVVSNAQGSLQSSTATLNVLSGSVSGLIGAYTGSGVGTASVTTTATGAGGLGVYSYTWSYVSGTSFTMTPAGNTCQFSYTHNVAGSPSFFGVYQVIVSDGAFQTTVQFTIELDFS